MKFIALKTCDGGAKGRISFCCKALKVTRQGFHEYLKNRKVEDILIACTDNLTGFSEAIAAVFQKTDIQNCIIYQLRNSSKYAFYKDIKALMADLKRVYQAVDEQSELAALDDFAEIREKNILRSQKSKAVFPTDDSLFKMLYLAMPDITKKWTGRRQDWAQIYPLLTLYYSGRIPE